MDSDSVASYSIFMRHKKQILALSKIKAVKIK